MASRWSLKKALLCSLIGALALSALAGIYIFVMGEFTEGETKILVTALSLAGFSLTSLGCTFVLEKRKAVWLAAPGLGSSAWGFVWSLLLIWPEWETEFAAKTMVVLVLLAFSFAQSSLLALARLQERWAWVFPAAVGCIFALATLLSGMLIFEADDEFLFRVVGVLGILDATATLSIPILYRLAGKPPEEPVASGKELPKQDWRIELACPRCGHRDAYPVGLIVCPKCSLALRVAIVEGEGGKPFQLSLKAILMVFLVVSLPLGWVGFRIGQLRAQAAVVRKLNEHQPQLNYQFGNLRFVDFGNADPQKFDPSVLKHLKELPRLSYLGLGGMPVTDDVLAHLETMKLTWLDLSGTRITDAGLVYLEDLSQLKFVDVSRTRVTDQGAKRLAGKRPDLQVLR